ncbi:MAG TPA: ABC transporter permease [Polyangiaceae bacterium]
MRRILAVMERDLLRVLRNPAAVLSSVLLPVVYLLILGNSLNGPLTGLRLGVVNEDQGPQARALLGALQAVEHGPRSVSLVPLDDPETGFEMLHEGSISGLLVVPSSFSRDLSRGIAASAGLYVDNVDAIAATTIEGVVQGALPALAHPVVRFEQHLGAAEIRPQEIFPRVDYDTSLIPGVVVMSLFMGSMLSGAFNLIMDRFLGVHESFLSTPLRKLDINLGILLSGTTVTLVSSTLVLGIGFLLTGARVHGGLPGYAALFGVMVLTGLGMLAMTMTIMGRAGHPRIAGVINGFLSVILFFPSGALYPLASFPPWLRGFAQVDPETHAVAALKAILFRGGDISAAGRHVGFLAIFTVAMLVLSTATMKRTL